MADEVIIRRATEQDLSSVLDITAEVVAMLNEEGNYQWNHEYPLESDFRKDVVDEVLWVATVDGKVIGFAALTQDQPEEYAEVGLDLSQTAIVPHRVAVSCRFQKGGVSTAFMKKAEEIARELNIDRLRVDTNVINKRMQRVCEKLNYKELGEISFKHKPEIYGKMLFKVYEKLL